MKLILINVWTSIVLTSAAQNNSEFKVLGTVQALSRDTTLFLVLNTDSKDTMGITTSKKGKFRFNGLLNSEIEWASVRIDGKGTWPSFLLENNKLTINGVNDKWNDALIVGTKEMNYVNELKGRLKSSSEYPLVIKEKFISEHPQSVYSRSEEHTSELQS